MKWTTDPVTQVLAKLRDSAALQGADFCRAYPDQMKPSRLLRPVVAARPRRTHTPAACTCKPP